MTYRYRWTPRPEWYVTRGWTIIARKTGRDYDSWLVRRPRRR